MKKKSLFILAAVLVLSALTLACTVYASNAEVVPGMPRETVLSAWLTLC